MQKINKMKNYLLILIIGLSLWSCESEIETTKAIKKTTHLFTFKANGLDLKPMALYAFWGNKQIFLDSLFPKNNCISYNLFEKCNPGVYRVLNKEIALDFIYHEDSIEIEIQNNSNQPFKIKNSKQNEKLYEFLLTLNFIEQNDSLCSRSSELLQPLINKESNSSFVGQIMHLIQRTSFYCEEDKSKEALMRLAHDTILFRNKLMATPYFSSQLTNFINQLSEFSEVEILEVKKALIETANSADQKHLIHKLFKENALLNKQLKVLLNEYTTLDSAFYLTNYKESLTFADAGTNLSSQRLGLDNVEQVLIIFDENNPLDKTKFQSFKIKNPDLVIYPLNEKKLSQSQKIDMCIYGTPVLLMLDKNLNIIDRYDGKRDIDFFIMRE